MNYLSGPILTLALFGVCFFIAFFVKLALPEKKPPRRKAPQKRRERRERVYFYADLKPLPPEKEREVAKAEERSSRYAG